MMTNDKWRMKNDKMKNIMLSIENEKKRQSFKSYWKKFGLAIKERNGKAMGKIEENIISRS